MALALNNLTKVDMPLNKETKPSTNCTEAINSVDSKNWILAMWKEFDSFVENNTFEW